MSAATISRRELIGAALAIGAIPAFAGARRRSRVAWREDRARYPEGVASGDPTHDSLILWTRREPLSGEVGSRLDAEIAEDPHFRKVVASRTVELSEKADWTCRMLVGGLSPSRIYWYRFTDQHGHGSRIGRTRTAPRPNDARAVSFAFVSCQNANMGPLTPWRRMAHDDSIAPDGEQIEFVLHLGDFVYETVWLPEDRPKGYFDRTLRHVVDYPNGERHDDYHVPVTLADYRALYRAYLADPDLQDARARWPFVTIWDNGEYSNDGWQGLQRFGSKTISAQTRKVAANQAWFEFIPARIRTIDGSLATFSAPNIVDAPVTRFDRNGLGQEPNNLAAIASLTGYRAHRWGRHVELILTDQRTYRSEDYTAAPEAKAISSKQFPQLVPFESLEMIDAGREWEGGKPPELLRFADREILNFRKDAEPRTLLGAEQKSWFLKRLAASSATWKIWGDTVATFDMRADPQNLPVGLTNPWPGKGYAGFARTDHSTAFTERAEIYDFVSDHGITGFVTLSGDRHSFWAGYAAKALPPADFTPVGVAFVGGSISSPGMIEALEYILPKEHPLRTLYLIDRPGRTKPEAAVNLLLRHGVRTCLEYAANGDLARAKALANPGNAPHVQFVDMGGHGYGVVRAEATRLDVEFVCTPRPIEPTAEANGGPLRYRVKHSTPLWKVGERPEMSTTLLEGDAELSG